MISCNYTSKEANDFLLVLWKFNHGYRKSTTTKNLDQLSPIILRGVSLCVDDKLINIHVYPTRTQFQSQRKLFL